MTPVEAINALTHTLNGLTPAQVTRTIALARLIDEQADMIDRARATADILRQLPTADANRVVRFVDTTLGNRKGGRGAR